MGKTTNLLGGTNTKLLGCMLVPHYSKCLIPVCQAALTHWSRGQVHLEAAYFA